MEMYLIFLIPDAIIQKLVIQTGSKTSQYKKLRVITMNRYQRCLLKLRP